MFAVELTAGGNVSDIAIDGRIRNYDTGSQCIIDEGGVVHAFQLHQVVLAIGDFRGAAVLESRLVRVHRYDAADRIASEERSLRSFQNFHPVNVVNVGLHVGHAHSHYIVNVHADGRTSSGRIVKNECASEREIALGAAAGHVNEA